MTRFARAKGSKASNERVPEKSTPWNVMKEDMARKKQENEENKEREKLNKIRQENYDNFLKEQAGKVKTKWAEFPSASKVKKIEKTIDKSKNKKMKEKINISKKEMLELLKPDPEIDAKVSNLTSKIVKVLNNECIKDKVSKKKITVDTENQENNMKEKKKINTLSTPVNQEINDNKSNENIDDAPVEASSKIEPPKVVASKKKSKKKPLIINPNPSTNEIQENAATESPKSDKPKTVKKEMTKSMKRRMKKNLKNLKAKNEETNAEEISNQQNEKNLNKNKRKINDVENNGGINKKERFDKENNKFNSPRKGDKDNQDPNNCNFNSRFPKKQQPIKVAKVRDNLEHKRRKPDEGPQKMIFNGVEVEIVKFDGFPVRKEDAERLKELKKQMVAKGIPRSEVKRTLQLERRKAEKFLAREKRTVCFQCRKTGHMLSECPALNNDELITSGSGICYKCGSTEHTHFECKITKGEDFKFASCFICREQGHIAKQCPDNPKGMYPQGGACKLCGDVTHLKKDCPKNMQEKEDNTLFLNTISGGNLEAIDDELHVNKTLKPNYAKNKVVKF